MTMQCLRCGCVLNDRDRAEKETQVAGPRLDANEPCPNCGGLSWSPLLEATIAFSPASNPLAGQRISHFILVRRLGHGTFGEVWLADDLTLGRQVALKLPKMQAYDSSFLMFEAKTAASLQHEGIVRVLEVGNEGGQVFIASEFIDGMTLQDLISAGKPPLPRVLELMIAISTALEFAHRSGIVHRDIKPANILLNRQGRPYIADFGIAKRINADATISQEGKVIGTARYMSPEQASGKSHETDRRSDIYALGVMLFELLTGEVPFRGTVQAILHQKTVEDAPSPRTLVPTASRDVETICLKCLERDPARRYSTAQELADELQRVQAGEPIRARPIGRWERGWRWCQRRPMVASLLASLFFSLTAGLTGVTWFWLDAEQSGNAARQSLYRSWMNLASVHLSNGDYSGVNQLLMRTTADPATARLRGFEWDYFKTVIAPLVEVANHGEAVLDVALSRDGDLCASVSQEPGIRVWNCQTRKPLAWLRVNDVQFRSLDFSPTSSMLASGGGDGYVRMWQPSQQEHPVWQMEHGPPIVLVRFSPKGDRLLTVGRSGAVRLWDASNGHRLAEIPTGKRSEMRDVRFTPDGKRLIVASQDGHVRVWSLDPLNESSPHREFDISRSLECIALTDDGETLIAGNYYGHITTMTLSDNSESTYRSLWGRIDDIELVKGTRTALIVSSDGRLHVFDLDLQHEIRALNTHGLTTGILTRSADGSAIAIGSGDGAVTRIKIGDVHTPDIYWQESPVRDLVLLEERHQIFEIDDAGQIRNWNLRTAQSELVDSLAGSKWRKMALAPSRDMLAIVGTGDAARLWNISGQKVVGEIPVGTTGAVAVRFSPDGQHLAIGTRRSGVLLCDVPSGKHSALGGTVRPAIVNAMDFAPDGRSLIIAWNDGLIECRTVETGQVQQPIMQLSVEPTAIELCDAAASLFAIATATGEIHLWDLSTKSTRVVIKGHTGRINALRKLPGRSVLISGGRDRYLKLWDLPSAELIAPLAGHPRQVFALTTDLEGRTIYSGDLGGEIRAWRTH